jgi:hypothetical protein
MNCGFSLECRSCYGGNPAHGLIVFGWFFCPARLFPVTEID